MSAPLSLTSEQLRDLSYALSELTKIRNNYGVEVGSYGEASVTISDTSLRIKWDAGDDERDAAYILDDWIGS